MAGLLVVIPTIRWRVDTAGNGAVVVSINFTLPTTSTICPGALALNLMQPGMTGNYVISQVNSY